MAKGKREAENGSNLKKAAIALIVILLIAGVAYGATKLIKKKANQDQQKQSSTEFEKEMTNN